MDIPRRSFSPLFRWAWSGSLCALAAGALLGSSASVAQAQPLTGLQAAGHAIPTDNYFALIGLLNEGEYKKALDGYRSELKGGMKFGQQRWIDSICYFTMTGEALYRMGQYSEAMDCYNSALNLYVSLHDWMPRVEFTPPQPATNLKPVPWGVSRRGAKPAIFSKSTKFLVMMGRIDNSTVLTTGGTVQAPVKIPVCVHEIVRCTTLALHRRRQLLGPVCPQDALTDQVIGALARGASLPNHWSEAWVDVQLGTAYASAGKSAQAIPLLKRSLLIGGQYDHPLTCMALLELGELSLEAGDLTSALNYFDEASYSAADYGDFSVLEEAFRYGQIAHLMSNKQAMFPPLSKAAQWAKNKSSMLLASLDLLGAENYTALGQSQSALKTLLEAKVAIGKHDMGLRDIGARLHYITAVANYQNGAVAAGDEALGTALEWEKTGSKWLYQIGVTDKLYLGGQISPRVASVLYNILLRDPQSADWGFDPLESLSVLVTPHSSVYEHWFETLMRPDRKDFDLAIEVADRARRHRFFSTQPMGGRLLALRWILEAPVDALDDKSKLQRQDLLVRYPKYAELSKQAGQVKDQVLKSPLAPDDAGARHDQATLLANLLKISQSQEVILREIAARREPAELSFPPLRSAKEVRAGLPPKTKVLDFFVTSKQTYAFLMGSDNKYVDWQVAPTPQLEKSCAALLQKMGHFDANREIPVAQLDASWKKPAKEALVALLAGASMVDKDSLANYLAENVEELVIVPDGFLWYLPFEALQIGDNDKQTALLTKMRIRYAPTLGMALPGKQNRAPDTNVAVPLGKLFPRDDASVAQTAFDQLKRAVPNAVALRGPLWAPSSLYSTLFDGLITFDDIAFDDNKPFDWSPMPLDKTKNAGSLTSWFPLPAGGPQDVILPGFHTAAENGLKKIPALAGNEVFLAICGLMSTGPRTVLISRWRTGGQTSYDLMRQFAQELPFSLADDAWQRSVEIVSAQPLTPDAEPRIKHNGGGDPPKADHPFFWSAYLLVDSGTPPEKVEKPAEPPKLDFNKK